MVKPSTYLMEPARRLVQDDAGRHTSKVIAGEPVLTGQLIGRMPDRFKDPLQ